jgi:hypothetical protein
MRRQLGVRPTNRGARNFGGMRSANSQAYDLRLVKWRVIGQCHF